MNPNPKSTKEAMPGAAQAEKFEAAMAGFPAEMATLFGKAVERTAQMQKVALECTVQQAVETLDCLKKSLPNLPGAFVFDMIGQAVEQSAETHKKVLDMFVEQSLAVVEYSKQRGDTVSKVMTGVNSLVQQSVERGVSAQRTVLNFAAEQNRVMADAMKKQVSAFGNSPAAMAAADSMQKGMDALIDTHKELLEIAAKPIKSAAAR